MNFCLQVEPSFLRWWDDGISSSYDTPAVRCISETRYGIRTRIADAQFWSLIILLSFKISLSSFPHLCILISSMRLSNMNMIGPPGAAQPPQPRSGWRAMLQLECKNQLFWNTVDQAYFSYKNWRLCNFFPAHTLSNIVLDASLLENIQSPIAIIAYQDSNLRFFAEIWTFSFPLAPMSAIL